AGKLAEEGAEVPELVPGTGVEDDDDLGLAVVLVGRVEALDAAGRVEEPVARRDDAGNGQPCLLAQVLERVCQRQHGAEAVAIGANVGRQQESLVTAGQIDKRGPVQRHGGPFVVSRVSGMIIRPPAEGGTQEAAPTGRAARLAGAVTLT